MFKGKEVKIALVCDAKKIYCDLKRIVADEVKSGKIGTENQKLLKSIERTIFCLKENPQFGVHISKKKIPSYYLEEFGVRNLWKCNLFGFWRLIYWVDGVDVKIICFVLDVLNHKRYDKKFNYKSK